MLIISSALAAIIPMGIYMFLIWWFDRYDREPFKMVLNNYLWGSLGAVVLTLIISGSFSKVFSFFILEPDQLRRVETIIIAPIVEEIIKGAFLLITVSSFKFDNMTDGIVYGGAIGLGFGMTENFFYFISFGQTVEQWLILVIIRTLFSAVMHCVSTATLGAFIGYAKFKKSFIKYSFPFTNTKKHFPSLSLVLVKTSPVCVLTNITVSPGLTFCLKSTTVVLIRTLSGSTCAEAKLCIPKKRKTENNKNVILFFIVFFVLEYFI